MFQRDIVVIVNRSQARYVNSVRRFNLLESCSSMHDPLESSSSMHPIKYYVIFTFMNVGACTYVCIHVCQGDERCSDPITSLFKGLLGSFLSVANTRSQVVHPVMVAYLLGLDAGFQDPGFGHGSAKSLTSLG